MKKRESKKKNQTFSISGDVSLELHTYVKPIRKELVSKKEELRKAYFAANRDQGQTDAMTEWGNTVGDGSDEC